MNRCDTKWVSLDGGIPLWESGHIFISFQLYGQHRVYKFWIIKTLIITFSFIYNIDYVEIFAWEYFFQQITGSEVTTAWTNVCAGQYIHEYYMGRQNYQILTCEDAKM